MDVSSLKVVVTSVIIIIFLWVANIQSLLIGVIKFLSSFNLLIEIVIVLHR